ncbi:MAG TPA: peptidase [Gammaproteobacteria bacterium]|jgi:penicillin-binding protein 1A|nr:peptidase [Gammaproteobacteria bacterium]|tara:strand:- start:6354 stop:8717 length:2364 start_codon:yes stop_codon:yes gene_type:complete
MRRPASTFRLFFMLIRALFWLSAAILATVSVTLVAVITVIWPDLPPTSEVQDIRLKEPLRIYSIDGRLIGEFGDERRITVQIEDTPQELINAILAAEDDRFFSHHGVDPLGVVRALIINLKSRETRQGASTITMQVARNYFLSREKTYSRKLKEALLAFRLERELDKAQILELYVNKIFLGHRSFGFQAAAAFYYNKPLGELTLAQLAMLAGLPKAPSSINPVSNPARALERRNYVLRRMHGLGMIDDPAYDRERAMPLTAARHRQEIEVNAPYISEMVREYMFSQYGQSAYESGYRVYTTINARYQSAAREALTHGLLAYGERHGYQGPAGYIDPAKTTSTTERIEALAQYRVIGGLRPTMVLRPGGDMLEVLTADRQTLSLDYQGWRWTSRSPSQLLHPGDVIYISGNHQDELRLAQVPRVQGALVSLNPSDGSLLALVGGFDFAESNFNRATQALRQPGSNIKPFIYSAALENGFTAASLVSGAPVVIADDIGEDWRPQNYSRKVFGPTRLREALSMSLNLVSVRLVRALGVDAVRDYLEKFGFDRARLPQGLSLALGSATATPIEIARAYSVFANGGYLVEPFFITRVEDPSGRIIEYANRKMSCSGCEAPLLEPSGTSQQLPDPRFSKLVVSPQNAFILDSMMREVIRSGTGRAARTLLRDDIAGKTGTTNNYFDAWFTGYSSNIVTTVWVGFDHPRDLGQGESGARAALPIWVDFMKTALAGKPHPRQRYPENIIQVRVNNRSGLPTDVDDPDGYEEFFVRGTEPKTPHAESQVDPVEGLF